MTGLDGLIAAFLELDVKLDKAIVRKGLRKAAKLLAADYKANVPRRTGKYASAIKVRSGKRKTGRIAMMVTISGKDFDSTGKTGKGFFYPAILEYGRHRKDGSWSIEPGGDLRKEFDAKGQEAIDLALQTYRDLIEHFKNATEEND